MCTVSVTVPNDFINANNITDASAYARLMFAVGIYMAKDVSVGYAAQLAGVPEEDFIKTLGKLNVPLSDGLRDEEILEDFETAKAWVV